MWGNQAPTSDFARVTGDGRTRKATLKAALAAPARDATAREVSEHRLLLGSGSEGEDTADELPAAGLNSALGRCCTFRWKRER